MRILGTKFYGHDSSIVSIDLKKKSIYAVTTERRTRVKHDSGSVRPVLEDIADSYFDVVSQGFGSWGNGDTAHEQKLSGVVGAIEADIVREVICPKSIADIKAPNPIDRYKSKAFALFADLNEQCNAGSGNSIHTINELSNRWYIDYNLRDARVNYGLLEFEDHHISHALSSYFLSPFTSDAALCISIDGQGDGMFASASIVKKGYVRLISRSPVGLYSHNVKNTPISIGSIYTLFTVAMGWRANSDEGRVEALAAFGVRDENLYSILKSAIYCDSLQLKFRPEKVGDLFSLSFLIKERGRVGDENFCRTIQDFLDELVLRHVKNLVDITGVRRICLSGGVAANVIMSMRLFEQIEDIEVFVVPCMGDEGVALGAALSSALKWGGVRPEDLEFIRSGDMPYWGRAFSNAEISYELEGHKIEYKKLSEDEQIQDCVEELSAGKVVGWFHGRMEFGPRALGNRSILGLPQFPGLRDRLNVQIKRRPSWQPFCPSILEEDRDFLFERSYFSPHMATAFHVRDNRRNLLPEGIHADGTARAQFVKPGNNEKYWKLLRGIKDRTGVGAVTNTSFNLNGRTMCESPAHAIIDFLDCDLDALYIGDYKVERSRGAEVLP